MEYGCSFTLESDGTMSLFEPDAIDVQKTKSPLSVDEAIAPHSGHQTTLGTQPGASSRWLIGGILLGFIILFGRLTYLQVVQAEAYKEIAVGNHVRYLPLPPVRGIIVDRHGEVIAENEAVFDLLATPADIPQDKEQRDRLQRGIENTLQVPLKTSLSSLPTIGNTPQNILQGIPHSQALLAFSQLDAWPGINIIETQDRKYPLNEKAAHFLGTMGKIQAEDLEHIDTREYRLSDRLGQSGLEKTYEAELRGMSGWQRVEIDSFGHIASIQDTLQPQAGHILHSTLDAELQRVAYDSLLKQTKRAQVRKGSVIGIDPRNGQIRIDVNLPSYDAQEMTRGLSTSSYQALYSDDAEPLFHRTVGGAYPPGSTFKPFVAYAALVEQVIARSTRIFDGGKINVGPWVFRNYSTSGKGWITVEEAIAFSINVFFYEIGGGYEKLVGLGAARIKAYAQDFGFGEVTQSDIGLEAEGLLPDPGWKERIKNETWYIGDTYHMAIGQGDVLATPLQLARAYAALANGGTLYRPQSISAWEDREGKQRTVEPIVEKELKLDSSALETVRDGLRMTVTSGTARSLHAVPISISGKTGTAEYVIPNTNGKTGLHAWFAGYAPSEGPSLVVIVLIEGAGEGSDYAVPVARDIFAAYAAMEDPT